MKIAIIGGGLSGSNIYRLLKKDLHDVTIFEKSRGAGGRCSTRYIGKKLIDHGTPFFETTSDKFMEFCDDKVDEGVLTKKDKIYLPTNGMNKICSSMIDQNDMVTNTKIISCKYIDKKWQLSDDEQNIYDGFDSLIITIPAPQILKLDMMLSTNIVNRLLSVKYRSIATMLIYKWNSQNELETKQFEDYNLKKIVNNSQKYNYKDFSSYVVHIFSNKRYKNAFYDENFEIVPHFWKYALVEKGINCDYFYDKDTSLGICGDYFNTKNLEGSYLSSLKLFDEKLSVNL